MTDGRKQASWLVVALLAGCGGDASIAPVSGVIRLDGKPVVGARINTQPIGADGERYPGVGSFAVTDESGRYELELVQPARAGAIVGIHRVKIKQQKAIYRDERRDAPMLVTSPLPREASNGSLRLEVPPAGLDEADFDLVSE